MTIHRIHGNIGREDEIEARERAIRNLVEDRIQAAMEAGAFDNLPGKGRPLQLDENPYVPPELRLAYKVLADANFAPDWIERDKRVRAIRDEVEAMQRRHVAWLRRQAERPSRNVPARHRRARDELKRRLHEINHRIDELNLIVPLLSLQRPRLPVEDILSNFDAVCRKAYPGLDQ